MIGILLCYATLILIIVYGVKKHPPTTNSCHPFTKFSIVVVFRNEAINLPSLLNSLHQIQYPNNLYEIIFVDDASTDNSVQIINSWKPQIPNLKITTNQHTSLSPKKEGILKALQIANYDWIAITDADCLINPQWLLNLNNTILQQKPLLISGPVTCKTTPKLITHYQQLEFLALMGVTIGTFYFKKPIMCNGANIAYHKTTFLNIVDFHKKQTVSGDDIDTLESFTAQFPTQVIFNPQNLVYTQPLFKWKKLFQQKIRWAAKSTQFENKLAKLIGLMVLLTQVTIVIGFFLNTQLAFTMLIFKMGIDYYLVQQSASKLNQKVNRYFYIIASIWYPFINSWIGIKALIGGYKWKGRKFKR